MREYGTVSPNGILLRVTKQIMFVTILLSLEICLRVVQIILIVHFSRGLLFFVILLELNTCTLL